MSTLRRESRPSIKNNLCIQLSQMTDQLVLCENVSYPFIFEKKHIVEKVEPQVIL